MAGRLSRLSSSIVLSVSLALGLLVTLPASASDTQLIVSNTPSELVIGNPEAKSEGITLEIFLSSPRDLELRVEFIDYLAGETQSRVPLPAGTTPYSLANALEIEPYNPKYTRAGKQKRFEIRILPKKNFEPSIYVGAISVSAVPIGSNNAGMGSSGSVIKGLTVTPYGIASSLLDSGLAAAKIYRHDLKPLQRSSMIDSILPDLPGIVNYGPVESTVYYRNDGKIPVFAALSWKFESNGVSLASRTLQKSLLPAGKETQKSVATQVSGSTDGVYLNVLPSFGIVTNKITLTSSLGGTELPLQSFDGSFLVLQWKEPLVGIVAIYLLVRWAYRRNLSAKQRAETASLISLAIKDFFRKFGRKSKATQEVSTSVAASNVLQPRPYQTSYTPPGYPPYPGKGS